MVNRINRKKAILGILKRFPRITAEKVSKRAKITVNNARRLLLFYYRQSLVSRNKIDGLYHYSLTDNGKKRWIYLSK